MNLREFIIESCGVFKFKIGTVILVFMKKKFHNFSNIEFYEIFRISDIF